MPPHARQEAAPTTLHGETLEDNYRWMRDKSSPELVAYLEAENAYTHSVMAPTEALQAKLYAEMLSHIKETDESVPYRHRGWFYYVRTVERRQYPIHCRRLATGSDSHKFDPSQREHILLDVNQLAEGQPFMAVGEMSVSPDGSKLAYSTDNTGFRQYTMHVRDLRTGADLKDTAERVGSIEWAADSTTLFYTTEDAVTKRHDHLFRHRLGDAAAQDVVVYEEKDERFNLGVDKTRDGKYLLMEVGSHTTSEYRFLSAETPEGEFKTIAPRVDEQEYSVDHRDGLFYIQTNDVGKNFRVVTAPVESPDREFWSELIPMDKEAPLEDFELFASFCVSMRRRLGLPTLTVTTMGADGKLGGSREIDFPEPVYSAGANANPEFGTEKFRYSYQSLVSPASVYEYDVKSETSELLKQQEVPGGFDSSRYGSERVWVEAADGIKIPVSVVYLREYFKRDSKNPLYIYGYGSYGYPLPIGFSPSRLALLDRGVVIAYAHIRGGGEMGDLWHDAGKMMVKRNTFSDFIAVTEQLVAQGYGAKDRVAIEGGSAGGLLMGAVVNERPDLFRVVLSHVPFVDVMNTMLDETLPLTVGEFEEWGNPKQKTAFDYMITYSPYDNVEAKNYPDMLVKTSFNDSQVMYWEPAKYVAKMRAMRTDHNTLILKTNLSPSGHGGASGRYDRLHEAAFDYAYILREMGIEN